MQLHHTQGTPDWISVPPDERSWLLRLAGATHGTITPGNAISLLGLIAGIGGLYFIHSGEVLQGGLLLAGGRLFDLLDGYVADFTRTKSPLGAAVDASFDKIVAFAALAVLLTASIVPLWAVAVICLQSAANVVLALIARQRFVRLLPSRRGKNAVFGYWVALSLFILSSLLINHSVFDGLETAVLAVAYAGTVVSFMTGVLATLDYVHIVFGRDAEKYALLERFTRYIIVHNPVSADVYKLRDRLNELHEISPESEIIIFDTVRGGANANAPLFQQLASKLDEHTLVCIAGGDGTANMAIDILLRDPELPDNARKAPLLPLWCGNANDLAYMLSGWPTQQPIRKVMRHGGIVAVRPMECTLAYLNGKTESHLAACYASFGASAFATKEMEQTLRTESPIRRFGLSRLGQEFFSAAWALMRAPTFTVSEHGQTRVIFERTHLNGSRFAKVIGVPLRLTDERFHRATIEHKHLLTFILHIVGLIGDRDLAKKTITRDTFTVHDDVWAQFDGEAVRIPAGTEVRIRMAKQRFYAVSTRLNR